MSGTAIGIDLGTSGVRAALVDDAGDLVALAQAPIAAAARRTPAAWWEALTTAMARLRADAPLAGVRGIAVAGTSGTIVPCGPGGTVLAPASLYSDTAAPEDVAQVAACAAPASAARGATSPLARVLPWRVLAGLSHLLHEADWIAGRLLGRFGATDWNNALKTGFDPVSLTWPGWIAELGLDPGFLPRPSAPGTPLGHLDPAVAATLGLPPQAQVVAGTTDGCAAFLATGAAAEGDGVTSLGTTLTLKQLARHPVIAPEYGIYSHRIGDLWLAGGASNTGGAALLRHFSPARMVELGARIDPELASPLDYYPLPGPGERFPVADRDLAPRETPRPADDVAFLHGLLEGISRIEALGYRRLAELGAPPLAAVYTVGGGAANPTWSCIRARVLGVALRTPRSPEAAVGVARLALQSGWPDGLEASV